MVKFRRRLTQRSESGQTMILFALMAGVIMLTLALAVEGGRMYVEHKKMQVAADMAAVIAAQDLPCATGNSTCITKAQTEACNYATSNGFSDGSCPSGGSGNMTVKVDVPPVSCSPYDFMDYGNQSSNNKCAPSSSGRVTAAPSKYFYAEVEISNNLGTIPILGIPVTLSTHAVARHGIGGPGDNAVIALDQSNSCDIHLPTSSNSTFSVVGSVYANTSVCGGNGTTCDGAWLSASSSDSGSTTEVSNGTQTYAPAGCASGTGNDTSTAIGGAPTISDPYASGYPPPTGSFSESPAAQGTTMANCKACNYDGEVLNLGTGTWTSGNSTPFCGSGTHNGTVLELFPGIYPCGISMTNGATLYVNPGVYTLEGTFSTNGGTMCIFGAPVCDEGVTSGVTSQLTGADCATADFTSGSSTYVAPNTWYYYCSYWGFWDTSDHLGEPSVGGTRLDQAVPYFLDQSGNVTSKPLNGIVFYFPKGYSGGVTEQGNGGPVIYAGAPNSCPGTGTQTGTSISFPQGASAGTYTNPVSSLPLLDSISAGAGQLYPSADLTVAGECNDNLYAWKGEFVPNSQHLHFIFWSRDPSVSYSLAGTDHQKWWGIMYDPNGTVSLAGNSGGSKLSNNGPPWVAGQVIANDVTTNGAPTFSVFYRPCNPSSVPCGAGAGVGLVE